MSQHQKDILQHLADGDTVLQVAKDMNISPQTIHWHLKMCREFLGADTTLHAVTMAIRRGYIE